MNRSFRIASVLGIPIEINVSWLFTLVFVTLVLALQVYPREFSFRSAYRDDDAILWGMALASSAAFFISIVLHELAHSIVARRQGIPVKAITLFIFGGVSQIGGEARRPLHEFIIAIIGPFTSLVLGLIFGAIYFATGRPDDQPVIVVIEWLFFMNVILAIFNMAPGFPMDGGRVLRSIIWGVTGNLHRATRIATFAGRSLGYALIVIGGLAFVGVLSSIMNPYNGAWFVLLGLFLESSARQSWMQARALEILGRYKAEDIMVADLETAHTDDSLRSLAARGGRRFIFFVADLQDRVVGVLTDKEVTIDDATTAKTAADVMRRTEEVPTLERREDGASILQRMENEALWHMPVVDEGRVVGVVSRESLLRLLAQGLFPHEQRPAAGFPR